MLSSRARNSFNVYLILKKRVKSNLTVDLSTDLQFAALSALKTEQLDFKLVQFFGTPDVRYEDW